MTDAEWAAGFLDSAVEIRLGKADLPKGRGKMPRVSALGLVAPLYRLYKAAGGVVSQGRWSMGSVLDCDRLRLVVEHMTDPKRLKLLAAIRLIELQSSPEPDLVQVEALLMVIKALP